jgi:hypothetical protein
MIESAGGGPFSRRKSYLANGRTPSQARGALLVLALIFPGLLPDLHAQVTTLREAISATETASRRLSRKPRPD